MLDYQKEIDSFCRDVYIKTAEFPPIRKILGEAFTFEVLMGQPFKEAPVLFMGYQPGEWRLSPTEARLAGYETDWVVNGKSQYATEDWMLAKRLRSVFGPNNLHLLEKSVGLNAIFVRAPNIASYNKALSVADRKQIQRFCLTQNEDMIRIIKPKKILTLGFGTMDVFGPSRADLLGNDKRALTKMGFICEQETLAVRHLTGARFTASDYQLTVNRIREFLQLS